MTTPCGSYPITTGISVELVTDLDTLRQHNAYQTLINAQPNPLNLFFDPGWISTQAAHVLPSHSQPFFLLVWQDNRLIGAAPWVRETKNWVRAGLRRLYGFGDVGGLLTAPRTEILMDVPTNASLVVRTLYQFLQGPGRSLWDFLELGYVPTTAHWLKDFEQHFSGQPGAIESMQTGLIHLPEIPGGVLARMTNRQRHELLRRERRLREQCAQVEIRQWNHLPDSIWQRMVEIHRGHQSHLRRRGLPRNALGENPHETQTLKSLLDWAASRNYGRHYGLIIDQTLAAFTLCFRRGDFLVGYLTAFDDQFHKYSPSKVLFRHQLEQEISAGCRYADLQPGPSALKDLYCNHWLEHRHFTRVNRLSTTARLRHGWWQGLKHYQKQWLRPVEMFKSPPAG